jgi:hypothetical protein
VETFLIGLSRPLTVFHPTTPLHPSMLSLRIALPRCTARRRGIQRIAQWTAPFRARCRVSAPQPPPSNIPLTFPLPSSCDENRAFPQLPATLPKTPIAVSASLAGVRPPSRASAASASPPSAFSSRALCARAPGDTSPHSRRLRTRYMPRLSSSRADACASRWRTTWNPRGSSSRSAGYSTRTWAARANGVGGVRI